MWSTRWVGRKVARNEELPLDKQGEREIGGEMGEIVRERERQMNKERRVKRGRQREKSHRIHSDYILLLDMLLRYRNVLVMPIEESTLKRDR